MIISTTTGALVAGSLMTGATGFTAFQFIRSNGHLRTLQDVLAACNLCNKKKDGTPIPWKVVKSTKTPQGVRIALRYPLGKTFQDVTRQADAINTAMGTEIAYGRDGNLLILDIPEHPLPSYLSFSDRMMEMVQGDWKFAVGLSSAGWVIHDFNERPMILLGGLTRSGKTEVIRSIIAQIFLGHKESEYEMVGVDMKPNALEFRQFSTLWTELASSPAEFLSLLYKLGKDMKDRADKLAAAGCTNVKQYERMTGETFKRRFVIVDEYGKSFGSEEEKDITNMMMQLTAMGAGLGVHIILCTQRPDAEVVSGKIRANMGTVICMQVANGTQSRVILGHEGAEDLPEIPGRAIYQAYGKEWTVQTPFVSDKKMERIIPKTRSIQPVRIAKGDIEPPRDNHVRLQPE